MCQYFLKHPVAPPPPPIRRGLSTHLKAEVSFHERLFVTSPVSLLLCYWFSNAEAKCFSNCLVMAPIRRVDIVLSGIGGINPCPTGRHSYRDPPPVFLNISQTNKAIDTKLSALNFTSCVQIQISYLP